MDSASHESIDGPVSVLVTEDSLAPVVTFAEPAPGTTAVRGATMEVAAIVEDDNDVSSVEFKRDGAIVATLTRPPWRAALAIPSSTTAGTVTLGVRATDESGNVAEWVERNGCSAASRA